MKLHFLGTGSSYPTTRRGVSATALQHDDGCVWLFDCGEGTQIQAQKVAVSRQKINKIFITHLHGDHIFGLPGLLCTISSQMGLVEEQVKKKGPPIIEIFGPFGISRFITTALTLSQSPLLYQFRVHELVPEEVQHTQGGEDFRVDICSETTCHPSQLPGTHIRATSDTIGNFHWQLIDDERWCVSAGWIHHRVPTFGYVIKEKDRPGTLDTNKLLSLGIKPGPVYGQLKGGKSVTTENGERVTPEMVVGPAIPGRTVVILGDTSDASPLAHLVESCDVVVHEATHDDTLKDKALEFGHSTPSQAVHFAKTISAKTLLLNHFSQRYLPTCKEATKNEESIALLEEQALTAAEGTTLHVQCTDDLFVYDMPSHPRHNVQT
ncbi:zinc phosphodiesterase ELAC protein 1-like [Homarus americanus]|uniref:zinc phosphodiesterase ELAC protein 1-like n=1 Tax=Homarus americanus TaxID=6706 RepID=UPI001C44BA27|nr:zinc phosphodiesterase ELAC protein 1-like [Homarus americanus]XP_042213112.1 zinc phosphodiesterase ELAC protein 1-like [Homarus americanus]XP_042213113.1 zinc phosphodiesterase ELAC protein 1-like [Homarus americanus]XP_042213114.1 zinc phosphodiesterase ELAC protein 1-like [Homarus americanus]XP_042213115.1 zinc phosphodiesterase ELAC protein 1-like [Homarus americanus]XP_042213116.1 zinc phosphodiesterase ELAC protein 1-like [Homarus americanus]XP_042213117.1 zinc phosphodiesterase ELA